MKKKILMALGVVLTSCLLVGAGAFAATNINLIINGKKVNADIKVIDGVTYLPLRAISQNVPGVTLSYDATTKTVTLTSSNSASGSSSSNSNSSSQQSSSSSELGFSRKNPAPIGTTLNFTQNSILDNYSGQLTLEQVIRGEQANDMIYQANMFNDDPKDGYEYLLAKFSVKITKNKNSDATVDINSTLFTLVSTEGKDYPTALVVEPDPQMDANLYEGASADGWVAFQVKTTDLNPLITFGRSYDGTGGVWFKP